MCRYVLVDLGRKNRTFQDNTEMVHLDDANILDNLRSLVFGRTWNLGREIHFPMRLQSKWTWFHRRPSCFAMQKSDSRFIFWSLPGKRYVKDDIYTYTANVLLAVNPYKSLSHLYSREVAWRLRLLLLLLLLLFVVVVVVVVLGVLLYTCKMPHGKRYGLKCPYRLQRIISPSKGEGLRVKSLSLDRLCVQNQRPFLSFPRCRWWTNIGARIQVLCHRILMPFRMWHIDRCWGIVRIRQGPFLLQSRM